MKEKAAVFLAVLAIALSTPLLTTLLATESIAFSNRFYLQQYEKLDLKQASGFERQEFIQFSQALWDYFHNRISSPQVIISSPHGPQPLYKEHEIAHLADVRYLFRLGFAIRNLAAALLIASIGLILSIKKTRALPIISTAIVAGSVVGIAFFLLLLIAVQLDFNRAFTYFHLLSFDNMLWQLDPATDNLIKLFPEPFFLNATIAIVIRSLVTLAIALTACLLLLRPHFSKP